MEKPSPHPYRRAIEQFVPLSEADWAIYERHLKLKKIPEGGYLLQAGQVCRSIAFVKTGVLRMFKPTDEREITVDLVAENTFLTDYGSFLARRPSTMSIQALEPAEVWMLGYEQTQYLYATLVEGQKLGRLIAERLYLQTVERLESFYTERPEQRYARLMHQLAPVLGRVPQYYVASVLGVAPETLSRIRRRAGLTAVKGTPAPGSSPEPLDG